MKVLYNLLTAVCFLLPATGAMGQNWLMRNNDTVFVNACTYTTGHIFDNGGANGNYSNSFNGWVAITATPGTSISLSGSYNTESNYDKISVWDGTIQGGTLLVDAVSGSGNLNLQTHSGRITIYFHTDGSVVYGGFDFTFISCCGSSCVNVPTSLSISNITTTTADISWTAPNPAGPFRLTVGSHSMTVNNNHTTVNGLSPGTAYSVSVSSLANQGEVCCTRYGDFHTPCRDHVAFVYDDLTASNVTCRYGTFSNPAQNTGVVNQGSASASSRHTIHTQVGETDPRTGGHLKTIPDGYCSSVRLGNWSTGSQAERITYTYDVDTNDYDLLLLKYAAVLQDPSHNSSQQPRFTFDITDIYGNSLNVCYSANFISNPSLGWNYGTSSSVLWKDWTTVGVDLSPLHGQRIQITLTTYDCSQSGHYGYAYFVIDCDNKTLRSSSCQTEENTFFAPAGFSYRWYEAANPNTVLSTNDSLHVTTEGNYRCRLSFVGAPNDAAHQNCYFILTATSGIRFPFARFTPSQLDTSTCDQAWVRMQNRSIQTRDSAHMDSIANGCESYLWFFDDGTSSTEVNPRHGFSAGPHQATLYAMIADGSCVDSTQLSFMVVSPCLVVDTVQATICEGENYAIFDTVLTTAGTYQLDSLGLDGREWLRTVFLTVNSNSIRDTLATACDGFDWIDGERHTLSGSYYYHGINHLGCDSTVTLNLTIHPSHHRDTVATACDSFLWHDSTYTASTTAHTLSFSNQYGCDSTITLQLTVNYSTLSDTSVNVCDSYTWQGTTFDTATHYGFSIHSTHHTNAVGCDSTATLRLTLRRSSTGDTVVNICDTFTWYGSTYTLSTETPTHLSQNSVLCDSTTTLRLTVRHSTASTVADTIVQNQLPYSFNGVTFGDSISQTPVTIPNAALCDSTITYSLFVHWNVDTTLYDTLCNNALPHTWNGITHDTSLLNKNSITYADIVTLHNRYGADSTIYMYLTVHPLYDHHAYADICDNQSLSWGTPQRLIAPSYAPRSQVVSTDSLIVDSLQSIHLCDSLSSLHLSVHPTFDHHLNDTVCSNISYLWGTPQRVMFTPHSIGTSSPLPVGHIMASQPTLDTSWSDHLSTSHSCDSLSSLHLHIAPAYDIHQYDTLCDSHWNASSRTWTAHYYPYETDSFSTTGVYPFPLSSAHFACDSLRTLHLKIWPTYDLHFLDTIYDGDLYSFEGSTYDTTGTYPTLFSSFLSPLATFSCDSLRTLHLQRNRRTYIDTLVCQNELPLHWHGRSLGSQNHYINPHGLQVIKDSVHLSGTQGIDSLVVLTLFARDTAYSIDLVHTCDSLLWNHLPDTLFRESTTAPYLRLTQQLPLSTDGIDSQLRHGRYEPFSHHLAPYALQCDSVRHLHLTVDYTRHSTDYLMACDSLDWPTNPLSHTPTLRYYHDTQGTAGATGSHLAVGPVDTLLTVGGCDSVVTLDLALRHATYEETIDTFCFDQTYTWRRFSLQRDTNDPSSLYSTEDYYLSDTIPTHSFLHPNNRTVTLTCDSVLAIRLTRMGSPYISYHYEIDCPHKSFLVDATAAIDPGRNSALEPHLYWTAEPLDTSLVGQEEENHIVVSPQKTTTYRTVVDYHPMSQGGLCPIVGTLRLKPVVIPTADLQVNPEALTYEQMEFTAYDISHIAPYSPSPDSNDTWSRDWYLWYYGSDSPQWQHLAEESTNLYHKANPSADTLIVALAVFNGQCSDTATHVLPILRVALFPPNVFTPLRDDNNRFTLPSKGIISGHLFIYNRDGLLVYQTTDYTHGWDGRDPSGRVCEQGNYIWKLIYRADSRPHSDQVEVGSILLLR